MRRGRKDWMSFHFMQNLQSRVHSLVPNVSVKREFRAQMNRLVLKKGKAFVSQDRSVYLKEIKQDHGH